MRPIGKYIILKTISEEVKTGSGLLLSGEDAAQMRYAIGTVYRVGELATTIKEEDQVYYDKSASFRMIIEGEQYTIIQERDVVVVL